jgi:hypothetical protein
LIPALSRTDIEVSNSALVLSSLVIQLRTTPIRMVPESLAAVTKPVLFIMISRSHAASATVCAIGPGESWLALIGIIPPRGTEPTVGFIPTQPFRDAGQIIDPSVSLPTANRVRPAATAAPEPEEEPPALCLWIHGFAVKPPTADQPLVDFGERMFAHSERFVEPRIIAPAFLSRSTKVESFATGVLASANDPAVAGNPTASMLSLMRIGKP